MNNDTKKYGTVFLITLGIFIVVFGLVSTLNKQKIESIDDLQRKITIDLIATETQFDLLKTAPCNSIENTILSQELQELGEKLSFAQETQGVNDPNVEQLKKYYSLLQVKDYLLMEEFAGKCQLSIDSLLYFYSSDCKDCRKQGYILTEFKNKYPEVRIYSFDTELDFSVIDTFISLYNFEDIYPTMIINGEIHQEFTDLDQLEVLFPELVEKSVITERAELGIEYIITTEEYKDFSREDISFVKENDNVYEYVIERDGLEPESIQLVFDKDEDVFETENTQ